MKRVGESRNHKSREGRKEMGVGGAYKNKAKVIYSIKNIELYTGWIWYLCVIQFHGILTKTAFNLFHY